MPTWLLITIILLVVGCFTTACVTAYICNREKKSEWQKITYAGSSVEPKSIYICKRCNHQTLVNYNYCSNCGASMKNGVSYHCYPDEIKLSE